MTKIALPANVAVNLASHLSGIQTYIDLAEPAIRGAATDEKRRLEAANFASAGESQEAWQAYELTHSNAFLMAPDAGYSALEQQLTYSVIASLYMVFESHLASASSEVEKSRCLPVGLADLKGNSASEKARVYLRKLVGVTVGDYAEWAELMDLRRIRNAVVHSAGRLSDRDADRVRALAQSRPDDIGCVDDYFSDEPVLIVRMSMCRRYLDLIRSFFQRLFDAVGIRRQVEIQR